MKPPSKNTALRAGRRHHARGGAINVGPDASAAALDPFFYGQILNNAAVQTHMKADPIFKVLHLLTYGVWKDVAKEDAAVQAYVKEDKQLAQKLRMLTVLSMAETNKNIPYATLAKELGLDEAKVGGDAAAASTAAATGAASRWRELEDIVIDSTTAGLCTVTLNPQKSLVQIHDAAARDVNPSEVGTLLNLFQAWSARCGAVVSELNKAQANVREFESAQDEHTVRMLLTEDLQRRKALRAMVEFGAKGGALQ